MYGQVQIDCAKILGGARFDSEDTAENEAALGRIKLENKRVEEGTRTPDIQNHNLAL